MMAERDKWIDLPVRKQISFISGDDKSYGRGAQLLYLCGRSIILLV